MKKITKALHALRLIVANPYLLNAVLNNESVKRKEVIDKFGLIHGLPVVDLETILPEFEQSVSPYSYLSGMTTPIDIALLKALAQKYKVKTYFEIGTWRGESVANVAADVSTCCTFNLSKTEIVNLGYPKEYAELHGFFSEPLPNVTQLWGNSQTFDFSEYYGQYDMVFVDGDHHSDAVKKDTETAFKLLRDEHSIIVWHDYGSDTETIRWSVLSGILEGCPKEYRSKLFHVANTLCAIYIPNPVNTHPLVPFEKPRRYFEMNIKLREIK